QNRSELRSVGPAQGRRRRSGAAPVLEVAVPSRALVIVAQTIAFCCLPSGLRSQTVRLPGPPTPSAAPAPAVVRDLTHNSQAMSGPRVYQAILPGAYATSHKRYPVIYWLHGYEQPDAARDAEIAGYVTSHEVIVVKAGPVETTGTFPMY